MVTFSSLGLSPATLRALDVKGFEEPTDIQTQAIPLLLSSTQDVIAQAQTGTGKTATFGLVFTDKLNPKKSKPPQALVLTPTRELALQVSEELHSLRGEKNLTIVPIYGGQSWGLQRKHLDRGVDIVVGTPGRIIDHLQRGTLDLSHIEYFVLDEADEMLNMGFIEEIEKILESVNPAKKVLLFSATMPDRIARLAQKYMKNPVHIKAQKDPILKGGIDQIYFEVFEQDKFEALCRIMDLEEEFYGIVFCRTKVDADRVGKHLNDRGYQAEAFHGDITQDRREQILNNFRKRRTEILVATDVAARGIDVPSLTHVINYALPQDPESYVHRIGRTGRAGKKGKAITLITPPEYRKLKLFEHRAKTDIQKKIVPEACEIIDVKKRKMIKDIDLILQNPALLTPYEALAGEMLSGSDPQKTVAALLQYSFGEVLNQDSYKTIRETKSPREKNKKTNPRKEALPVSPMGTTRLFLTTGRADGATPAGLLQMIEQDFGVPKSLIGSIDIMPQFSFVTVPFREAEIILKAFEKSRRKSRPKVRIERVTKGKSTSKPSRSKSSKRGEIPSKKSSPRRGKK